MSRPREVSSGHDAHIGMLLYPALTQPDLTGPLSSSRASRTRPYTTV